MDNNTAVAGKPATDTAVVGRAERGESSAPLACRNGRIRLSLPFADWPEADRLAAMKAREPREGRFMPGGIAVHYRERTWNDLVRRYGLFLGSINRLGHVDRRAPAARHVNEKNVALFLDDLTSRQVSSVTLYGSICKLRTFAEILDPDRELEWLKEIERDLNAEQIPQSKFDPLHAHRRNRVCRLGLHRGSGGE